MKVFELKSVVNRTSNGLNLPYNRMELAFNSEIEF